jgi:hypothetical protein
LAGRELVVEDDQGGIAVVDEPFELVELALAEIGARMRAVELLGELADDERARRVGEPLQLAQMLVQRLARAGALQRRADEERPLDRGRDGDQIACDGSPSTAAGCRRPR